MKVVRIFLHVCSQLLLHPKYALRALTTSRNTLRALELSPVHAKRQASTAGLETDNPLVKWFDSHDKGRGIWKWRHYFDTYHRHFSAFIGKKLKLLEIGSYSGGSLDLWQWYFGDGLDLLVVDIARECEVYASDRVEVIIGNQGDPEFYKANKSKIQGIDIVVDDGSHIPQHQITSFECLFPQINPGGIYVIEDVQGLHNEFLDYVHGLNKGLCEALFDGKKGDIPAGELQSWIKGIHVYPFIIVFEKRQCPIERLLSEKRGVSWKPFSPKSTR